MKTTTTKRVMHGYRMLYGEQSNVWTFNVYECTGDWPKHSTIMSGQDLDLPAFAGRLGTRRLPAWIDALPVGKRRSLVVGRWHRAQYRAAYKLILSNLPRVFRSYRVKRASMGDITIDVTSQRPIKSSVSLPLN